MKKDFIEHVKLRESQLYNEFEQNLIQIESNVNKKFKSLLESNVIFSE